MRIFAVIPFFVIWASCAYAQVDKAPISSNRLIVFVHGILGDSKDTFTNTRTGMYWPDLLRRDGNNFERADIYSYDYYAGLRSDSPGISELAMAMAETLDQKVRIESYQSVLFIAHSMGGVIVRQYLLDQFLTDDHGVVADNRVKGIFLFGTPMNGSDVANYASHISNSLTLKQLWDSTGNPDSYLAKLSRDWINTGVGDSVRSSCAYETLGVVEWWFYRRDVVNWSSSAGLCNAGIEGVVGATHLSLVSPMDSGQPAHQMVRDWYQRLFSDKPIKPGDVVLASCEIDPYVDTFTPKIAKELTEASISHYGSIRLPRNWLHEDISYLWLRQRPKVIAIHFGCFANAMSDDANLEAADDFNLFLKDIEESGVKVVMYTRSYFPGFFEDRLTKENIAAYYRTRRIYPLALRHGNPDRSKEAKRLREIIADALNNRKPSYD